MTCPASFTGLVRWLVVSPVVLSGQVPARGRLHRCSSGSNIKEKQNEQIRKYYQATDVVHGVTADRFCGGMWG